MSTLGDSLDVVRNGVSKKQNKDGVGSPVSRIETIATGSVNLEKVGYTELEQNEKDKFKLEKGDILFSHINSPIHVGKSAVFECDQPLYHGMNLLLFRTTESVDSKYLNYFLNHLKDNGYWLRECKQSVNQASVNQKDVKKVEVPLPPLEGQRRIVALLDQAFEGLDRARANTEANLNSARELFEGILNEIYANNDFPLVRMDEACIKIQDGAHHSPKTTHGERTPHLYPYVTSKNIRNNRMKLDTLVFVDEDFHSTIYPRCNAEKSDILLTKDGASTGNVCLNEFDEPISLLSSVCLMKPNRELLVPEFLLYYLQSPTGFEQITGQMTGAAIKRIILRTIKASKIPLPDIEIQNELSSKISEALEAKEKAAGMYQEKLESLIALRQSLLAKAFAGELT